MTRTTLVRLAVFGAAALALSACGGHSGGSASSTSSGPTTARLEDQFGTQFGVDYRASPNAQPVKPLAGDIIPLTATAAPLPLH